MPLPLHSRLLLLCLIAVLTTLFGVAAAQPLNSRIEQIINEGAARRAIWGIYAVDTQTGTVLADINGSRLFVPASTRKLVSTAMATAVFRPDERLTTEVRALGEISGGVLRGNLAVIASGDPSWTPALMGGASGITRIRGLARAIAGAGVTRIDGDLVVDPGPYGGDHNPMPPGWSWEEFALMHGSTPSAFSINRNLVPVSIAPAVVGRPVDVSFPGSFDAFEVINESVTLSAGSAPTLTLDRMPGGGAIRLRGGMAVGATPAARSIPASNPTEYTARMLVEALSREGVTLTGGIRVGSVGRSDGRSLASIEGAPISEIVRETNLVSDNFLAESLYLLAASRSGGRANYRSAGAAESRYWRSARVADDLVVGADGSGLSRKNFIAPEAMVALLRERQNTDWFVASLPRSGHTGTLRGRLGGPLAGRVQAKTGTLDGTTALSGYVRGNSGRTIAFSILANNHSAGNSPIRGSVDRIVGVIAER